MENNPAQTNPTPTAMQTPTPQPPNPPAKKDGSSKLLLATIAVLLFGFGLLGGYLIAFNQNPPVQSEDKMVKESPTAEPTSVTVIDSTVDWKTYTSTDNSFSVKYPSDTFVRYICPGEELTLAVRKTETEETINMPTCNRGGRYNVEIAVLTQAFVEPQSRTNYSVTKEAATVAGLPATKYTIRPTDQQSSGDMPVVYSEDIYVTKNGETYLLHVSSEELKSTFDQILSTFKFLN